MAKNLTIQDEPVYNEQMEVLEPTTPAHADYFNERYAQLLNNGKANRRDAKIFEDDVNESGKTEERINSWVEEIKKYMVSLHLNPHYIHNQDG